MAALGVPYFYEEQCIIDQAAAVDNLASICSFCARMKRGRLYACARRNGYNVLAFGQHLVYYAMCVRGIWMLQQQNHRTTWPRAL
jgi:tRNA(Ile)-lysidine synthase TilS/MesJ